MASGALPPTEAAARCYIKCCATDAEFDATRMKEAVLAGDDLIRAAGGWREAVPVLRKMWIAEFGNPLDGIFDCEIDGWVRPDLLQYIRAVAREGAPARQPAQTGYVAALHTSRCEDMSRRLSRSSGQIPAAGAFCSAARR